MIRRCLLCLLLALSLPALAQVTVGYANLRSFPEGAKRAELSLPPTESNGYPLLTVGGTAYRLAPGAQLRDSRNLIVQPMALRNLSDSLPVRVLFSGEGADRVIWRLWALTPDEAKQRLPGD